MKQKDLMCDLAKESCLTTDSESSCNDYAEAQFELRKRLNDGETHNMDLCQREIDNMSKGPFPS